MGIMGLPRWLSVKESACNAKDTGDTNLIIGDTNLIKNTLSSIPSGKTPWTEKPDQLQSMRSQRVGQD